jgi:hypothetical protein
VGALQKFVEEEEVKSLKILRRIRPSDTEGHVVGIHCLQVKALREE